MKKLSITIFVVTSFIIGGVAGGYVIYTTQLDKNDSAIPQTNKADKDSVAVKPEQSPDDKISGYGLTPTEMYDELSTMEAGDKYDWRYLNYLQTLRMNEAAMSKMAADKITIPELKAIAVEQAQLSAELNDELARWRGVWGFTDH